MAEVIRIWEDSKSDERIFHVHIHNKHERIRVSMASAETHGDALRAVFYKLPLCVKTETNEQAPWGWSPYPSHGPVITDERIVEGAGVLLPVRKGLSK